jgi:hypothetical protein
MSSQQVEKSESQVYTKLVDKHYSPLVIRKITKLGFPIYIAIITDNDLTDFDDRILGFLEANKAEGWVNNIQTLRNLTGAFSEHLCEVYPKTEGVAIVIYADKCMISSLFGDFMNHGSCKAELIGYLNLMAHI